MRQAKGEQVKRELLPGQSVELLKELHLVGRDGALHADSLRKLKQVNHLLQLLDPALRDVLERHKEPVLVDAGAGNAYLGFVLYELYLKTTPCILYSVESRPELVDRGRERAQRLGFSNMKFLHAPGAPPPARLRQQPAPPRAPAGGGAPAAHSSAHCAARLRHRHRRCAPARA